MEAFNSLIEYAKLLMSNIGNIFLNIPTLKELYTASSRWIFMILALYIVTRAIRSLLSTKVPNEIWAYLSIEDGEAVPIKHWENVIGRSKHVDIPVDIMTVSRSHGSLVRDEDGNWFYNDLDSKSGSFINGQKVTKSTPVNIGDTITVGGVNCTLLPTSLEEQRWNKDAREKMTRTFTPWKSLIALTIFQVMLVVQLMFAMEEDFTISIPIGFGIFSAIMWGYSALVRSLGSKAFEIESIAFFLSTLGLAVCATSAPDEIFKQVLTIALGVILFISLCWYLRDLDRAMKIRKFLLIGSIILLMINILLGTNKYGATNWVSLGGFTFQPSELVKIAYILVGTCTLDELFEKKNLTMFLGFSIFCLGCLALMGDFGTASIFFVTFLVISFLRSGDFSKLILIVGAAGAAGLMVLRFKPYILGRFQTWMHAWDFPDAGGYQQTRTMSAGASGGLVGVGAGEGWLENIAAADTDLVFGILSEEWGLIIALLAVFSIVTLGIFAFRSIKAARSAFYTIAACAATTLFIFQTMLNVFGAVDIFPLTGVTFPFVSNGGTSMIVSWGLLAFLKAADTRSNASIAVRKTKLKGEEW